MSIVGLGLDLAGTERVGSFLERHGQRGLDRLFTAGEQAYCEARASRVVSYAGRFAVKEAVMKVLGTGWSEGVRWVDIEVVRDPDQAPRCVLHGESKNIAERKGIAAIHVTITHDAGLAAAVAVAEGP